MVQKRKLSQITPSDDPSKSSYDTLLSTFSNKQLMKQLKRKIRKEEEEQQEQSLLQKQNPQSQQQSSLSSTQKDVKQKVKKNDNHNEQTLTTKEEEQKQQQQQLISDYHNPFATYEDQPNFTFKVFEHEKKSQSNMFSDLIKDVKNRQVVSIDFSRKIHNVWFNHYCRPYTEQELNEMIEKFETNEDDVQQFKMFVEDDSSSQMYKSLGHRIQYNGHHRKLPTVFDDDHVDEYGIERDVMKLWRARVLCAQESVDHLRPNQFFKSNFQQGVFSIVNDYRDFYFSARNGANGDALLESLVLHTVNHMVKTRRYQMLNRQMREVLGEEEYVVRDGTLNPTTVLFLVPFRSTAHKITSLLLELLPKIAVEQVEKFDAFDYLFSEAADAEDEDDEDGDANGDGNDDDDGSEKKKSDKNRSKPEWWRNIFEGNVDDQFVLPMKFDLEQGKAEVMCKPSEGDIIIATPVALMAENKNDRFRAFLSSIEIVNVIDADVMLMQNWEHTISSFELLNVSPAQSKRTTFSVDWPTLKTPLLYEKAPYFRQNIITSRYMTPDINSLMQFCQNLRGMVKVRNIHPGVVSKGKGSVLQIFERYKCQKLKKDSDQRHDYFIKHIFPRFKKSSSGRFIIVVSSYLDYVRVRNYFNSERIQFFGLSEYTENTRNQLSKFRKEDTRYLLYTERHFYYHAPKLKEFKVNQIFFYSLPENDFIYQAFVERAGAIAKTYDACRVLSLYSTFDALKLERIVGTERCKALLTDEQNVHLIQK